MTSIVPGTKTVWRTAKKSCGECSPEVLGFSGKLTPGGGGGNRQQPFNVLMCNDNNQTRKSFRTSNILAVEQIKYRQCVTALEIVNDSITIINLTQEKTHTITFL